VKTLWLERIHPEAAGPSSFAKWAFFLYPVLIAGVLVLEWVSHDGNSWFERTAPDRSVASEPGQIVETITEP